MGSRARAARFETWEADSGKRGAQWPALHAVRPLPPSQLLQPRHAPRPAGPVSRFRLLGDTQHTSKISFVEFTTAESARGALKLSGALLGARGGMCLERRTSTLADGTSWAAEQLPAVNCQPHWV